MWLDLATWNSSVLLSDNYLDWAVDYPASTAVKVGFSESNTPSTAMTDGVECAAGQHCALAIKKSKLHRMGDSSGSNNWGNCETKTPYSFAACQQECHDVIGKEYCATSTTPRQVQSCIGAHILNKTRSNSAWNPCVALGRSPCYPPCSETKWTATVTARSSIPDPRYILHNQHQLAGWVNIQYQRAEAACSADPQNCQVPNIVDQQSSSMHSVETLHCAVNNTCSHRQLLQYVHQHAVKLVIYLESTSHEESVEVEMVPVSILAAALGGNLGLCLGISIMTIFEWLEFSVVALFAYTFCRSLPCGRDAFKRVHSTMQDDGDVLGESVLYVDGVEPKADEKAPSARDVQL